MKYMTFRASCSYAGLANLLAAHGIDTDDRSIAKAMHLPCLFAKENGVYLAGPMLQGTAWFDLYLRPMGLRTEECFLPKEELPAFLCGAGPCMLGLSVSPQDKHAVVFLRMQDDHFLFLNNKWETGDEPEHFALSKSDLLKRTDPTVAICRILPAEPEQVCFRPLLLASLRTLSQLKTDLTSFCSEERTAKELSEKLDPLFRAILLDTVTMAELDGNPTLAAQLTQIRGRLLEAFRSGESCDLTDILPLSALLLAIDAYAARIETALAQEE